MAHIARWTGSSRFQLPARRRSTLASRAPLTLRAGRILGATPPSQALPCGAVPALRARNVEFVARAGFVTESRFFAARGISTEALKPQDRRALAAAGHPSHGKTPGSCALCLCARARRSFERRHNSITPSELEDMLRVVGFKSLDALIDATVPADIRREVRAPGWLAP